MQRDDDLFWEAAGADAAVFEKRLPSGRPLSGAGSFRRTVQAVRQDRGSSDRRGVLSVSAFSRLISQNFQKAFPRVWVSGEIASFLRAGSGHCYFTLKDEAAQIDCVMFRYDAARLAALPKIGDKAEVQGALTLYEKSGRMQLKVSEIRRSGMGALYEAFLALKAKLEAEGLFDAASKRPIPLMPRSVGIVTSLRAAALRDAVRTLRRRAPYAAITVYPARVQGEGAASELIDALVRANERGRDDVLLLIRGGGSYEDLFCFNDEFLARTIRASGIPVVSGVGHESDTTIADLASDLRAATPTAAAEMAAADAAEQLSRLASLSEALKLWQRRLMDAAAQRLDAAAGRMPDLAAEFSRKQDDVRQQRERLRFSAVSLLQQEMNRLSSLRVRLVQSRGGTHGDRLKLQSLQFRLHGQMQTVLQQENLRISEVAGQLGQLRPDVRAALERQKALEKQLSALASGKLSEAAGRFSAVRGRFEALGIHRVLQRGFAILLKEGAAVSSTAGLKAGDTLQAQLSDGRLTLRVLSAENGSVPDAGNA